MVGVYVRVCFKNVSQRLFIRYLFGFIQAYLDRTCTE